MKKRDEALVGLLIIVSLVVGLGGTVWVARGGLSRNYPMYARFPWGVAIKQGQQVLLAGVAIGFVDNVTLDPNGTVVIDLKIQQQYKIPKGSTATVEANGIFGDQLIALRPVLNVREYLPAGDTIPTGKSSPGTAELLSKGDSIAADVKAITGRARMTFVDSGAIEDVRKTIAALSKLVGQLGNVATVQSAQLTKTQESLRHAIASIDSTKVDSTLTNARSASASLAKLSDELRATNTKLQGVIDKATNGDGSIAMLLNDKGKLYMHVDSILTHADSLIADIKKNPRKYINLTIF